LLTAVLLLAATVGWRPRPGAADTILELGGSRVRVEVATATPAPKGGRSRLQFRIVNEGRDPLHLISVRSDVAERADLVARTGASTETLLTSFPIPPGAELDLTTSHLRFELYPLRRDLVTDETFTAILDFVRWTIEVPVHVHEPTGDHDMP
jgi:copper(I)-binding protein